MLELYGHPFSSYTWKALIPLYELELDFAFRHLPEDGSGADWEFVREAHPGGKFPVLRDGETIVVEATAIVEYLSLYHDKAETLIPGQPELARQTRMLDRVFDNYVMHNMTRVVMAFIASADDPDMAEIEAAKADLIKAYRWLER